ncbi:hypothetical protein [Herbaspirillum robiniae]|uniref:hypothetical protein n=1 Tax=Herbaspirillum robiniae TaxID=2014887 RepID=UPI003D772B74
MTIGSVTSISTSSALAGTSLYDIKPPEPPQRHWPPPPAPVTGIEAAAAASSSSSSSSGGSPGSLYGGFYAVA